MLAGAFLSKSLIAPVFTVLAERPLAGLLVRAATGSCLAIVMPLILIDPAVAIIMFALFVGVVSRLC